MFQDILRRFLHSRGYRVLQVMNVTDVDDRIIHAPLRLRRNRESGEYTEKYIQAFLDDIDALHIEMPEEFVRATDHIEDMVALIETVARTSGFTYTSEGSTYFRISKFPSYGKLSKIDVRAIRN